MRRKGGLFVSFALVLALAACTEPEVGMSLDEGGFGNPTMENALYMTGRADMMVNLNTKFARDVPVMVNFAFDSAVLDPQARAILDRQANWIRQNPEVRFKVFGHTDLVGTNAYNKSLGLRRANAVVAYLASRGVSRSRLQAVVSFGKTQPIVLTNDPERRNRRTVTEITGFLKNPPAPLNGKYAQVIHREYVASATETSSKTEAGEIAGAP